MLHKCIANRHGENNTYQLVEKRKRIIRGKDIHPLYENYPYNKTKISTQVKIRTFLRNKDKNIF